MSLIALFNHTSSRNDVAVIRDDLEHLKLEGKLSSEFSICTEHVIIIDTLGVGEMI